MSEQAANHTGEVPYMHFSSQTVQKPISFRTRFQLCLTVVAGLLLPAIAPAQTFTPNWVQLSPATSPPAGASYAMAYDAAHGQIVLFGGISFNGFLSDTWVWDGATWTQKSPATSPPDRVYSSMAYDAAHGQIVLFGGRNDGGNFSDTWVWDGTNWTQKTPATSPSARFGSSMAYDAAHGQLIMFGGCNSVSYLSDTWVWDGSNWTQEAPATSPNGRDMATMTYDAAHGQIVLFGGADSSEFLNDTWLWNGSNWTLQSPGTSPGARVVSAMAYDASIGQTVLFGGNVSGYVNDTWLWDGTNWTEDFPATSPPARGLAAMAYDAASGQMVLFGGGASSEFLNDTWTWGLSSFGPQAVNTTSAAQTLNFSIPASTTVGSIAVFTQGATGLDFANAAGSTCTPQTYSSATTCTVNVSFTPKYPGLRMGAVVFFSGANNTGTILSTTYISGVGIGPQVAFNPAPAIAIGPTVGRLTLNLPFGVAVDGAGDLFIADTDNNRVVELPAGGGAAIPIDPTVGSTALNEPFGVAVDGAGDLFIADTYNNRVVELPAGGGAAIAIGPTVGSLTLNYPFGVAVDGAGDLFIADPDNNRVVELPAGGGAAIAIDPTVGSLTLHYPVGVAVDGAGDLFIADTYNSRVVELPAGGGAAIAIGPTVGSLTLNYSFGVAVDGAGDLFIADAVNNRVVELPAGGGPAIVLSPTVNGAQMTNPVGVTVDSAGDLFIADFGNNRVVKIQRPQPPTVSFPTATDDGSIDTDPTQTVQVSNSGNALLIFSALAYPTDFSAASDASACTSSISLSAGEECDLPIQFSPVSPASGPLSESVSLTTNATPAQQSVTVTGSAIDSSSTMTANAGTTPQSATVSTAFPNALAVTVLDAGGNPVAGVSVKFTAPATGASGTFSNGAGTITVLTNSSGVASAPITANATAGGFYTVTATANGLTTVNFHLMNLAGPPASMTATGGATPQTAYVTSAFGAALQVTVLDQYGNPVFGAVVTFTAPGSGASAALSSTAVITGLNGLASVTATANGVVGSYTVTASNSSLSTTFSLTNLPPPAYTVTTLTDDAGGAARNCNDTSQGATPNTGCSLRDAIAAAATVSTSTVTPTINFASSLNLTTSPPGDYNVTTGGTLNISKSMNIQGPGANLLSIDGGKADRVFNIASGTVSISEVTITNGNNGGNGGGIVNAGTLTVTNSTISGNSANGDKNGGGIYNIGTLTVTNSTFSGNSVLDSGGNFGGGGGGIFNQGTLTVTNSTFTGNSAGAGGGGGIVNNGTLTVTNSTVSGNFVSGGPSGGIFNYSTLTLTNSIVDGNWDGTSSTVGPYDDLVDGSGNTVFTSGAGNNGGNLVGNYNTQTMNAPTPAIQLAPLGNYGGPTQTMLPLPGSPAICAISPSTATGTDQRGDPRTTTYGTTTCQDSGAVQTNYSIVFVQQPSTVVQNAAMLPAPTIQLDESGVAFADGTDTIAIPLSLMTGSGTLSGGSVSTSATTGVATYSALSISLPGTSDVLTANLTLNYATTPETAISIASNPFNVNSAVAHLVYNPAPATTLTAGGNAGSVTVNEENSGGTLVTTASDTVTLTVTGPGSYSNTYTVTAVNGVATFNLSSAALTTAGSYSYAASIAGNSSVTAANAPELVSAASAASATVVSGTPQSATIGTAFAAALKVKVMDQYGNPVQGASVSFSAPSSGASATFTGSPAATVADGTASVTATANGLAGTAAYTVTASVSGAGTTASFLLTNTQASTTLTVTPSPTAIAYGQPVTISAAITPASVLTSSPTGTITFYDGLTALTPASTVASANASYMVSVPVVGSHTYAAQYGGDTNFSQSSLTSATSSVVVGKASTTLSGPSSTVNLTYGAGGLITVSVAGQFSGAGIGAPSGSVSYTIGSGTAQSAAIVSGTATLTIPASQAAGSYTFTVSYSGDGNYNAATSIPVNLVISKATATVTLGSLSQTYTGSALSATATTTPANLTVTFTYNGLTATPTAAGTYTVIGTVNDPNYLGSAIGTLVINKATPTVAWATPAVITYGTALNATQLDASSPVAGTFAYSPAAGTVLAAGSQELSVTFTPTDATDYTAATASVTLTVNVQTQTTSLASSTLAYASGVLFGVPPLTLSATSTSGLSVTFTLLSGPATLSGNSLTVNGAGTVAITSNQAGNANYAPAPQVVENITVNKALPIVSIASSANPVLLQNAITLSATIASGAGTPTGTVTFLDGSTPLGTGTLSGGVVTLTTSSLAAGTHSITAAYGGDANFLASTSSPLTQLVEDFNFNISSTSNNPSSSITVMPGGTAVFTFTVSPVDGSIFPAAVTLTLSGLPAGATYSFSPATIAAGAGATAITLTIDIPQTEADAKPLTLHPGAQLAVNRNGGSSGGQAGGVAGRLAPFSLALLLLPFAGRLRRTGKRLGRMMCALLLLGAGMATMAGMSGCGSTSGFFAQQQQSYTVTVTATSGALSHSTTVTLTVE
jgi:CSLREA domain-containing protein